MRVKTSELTGLALDYAVAKCEGMAKFSHLASSKYHFAPSTSWEQGGPIIEREGILLRAIRKYDYSLDGQWLAMYDGTNIGSMVQWVKRADFIRHYLSGPTPLIAAMRCYVASKLGEEVEIPEELMKGVNYAKKS